MTIRRTLPDSSTIRCDWCGQPSVWRTRLISTCCVLGKSLCDTCERKSLHTRWWNRDENFWRELAGDAAWLTRKISPRLDNLKEQIESGLPWLKPGLGRAGPLTEKHLPNQGFNPKTMATCGCVKYYF